MDNNFDASPAPMIDPAEAIWAAIDRADLNGAVALWDSVAPSGRSVDAFLAAALALRRLRRFEAAEQLLLAAMRLYPDHPYPWIDRAWLDMERGDLAAALIRWREARARAPGEPAVYTGEANTLRQLRRPADAEAVLAAAAARWPDAAGFRLDLAEAAAEAGDWPLAAARFRRIVAAEPDNLAAREQLIEALMALGQDAEAAALAGPNPPVGLLIRLAEAAEARGDPAAAEQCWTRVLAAADGDPTPTARAIAGVAETMFHQRRYQEADSLLADAVARYPDDVDVMRAYAACASQSDRPAVALERWRAAYRRFPEDLNSVSGLINALTESAEFAAARDLAEAKLALHPGDRGLREARAHLAARQREWPEAEAILAALVAAFPGDVRLRDKLMGVQFSARLERLGAADPAAPAPPPDRMAGLVAACESLGFNCDFGLLQRFYGVEPIGLLRWASIFPDQIVAAMRARFDGVGEAENTVIEVWPGGEYCISDRRYNMLTHSFTHESVVDRETFRRQQISRGRYLKRKLLEDIAAAEKLFVYQSAEMTDAQALALHEAMGAIGPAWLLVVRLADGARRAGTVVPAADRLLFGYIEDFDAFRGPAASAASVAGWSAIVERAHEMWRFGTAREQRAAAPAPAAPAPAGADESAAKPDEQCPDHPNRAVAWGLAAQQRQDWPAALRRWERVIEKFPGRPEGRRYAAEALIALNRHGDALTLLTPAVRLFPDNARIAILHATLLWRDADPAAAERLWRDVRDCFPDEALGHIRLAIVLVTQDRDDEAEAVLGDAAARFPGNQQIAIDFAMIPHRRRNWARALPRWRDAAARFPNLPKAASCLAEALLGTGDFAAAESAFDDAMTRFPDDFGVAQMHANAAVTTSGWPEAAARWRGVAARFPENPAALSGLGVALREAGYLDEAVERMRAAVLTCPENPEVAVQLALALSAQRDWPAALPVWASLKERNAQHPGVRFGIARALPQAVVDQAIAALPGSGAAPFEIPAILSREEPDPNPHRRGLKELLSRFESLGDTCEFGIVQRRFAAEPVSLLRWVGTPPHLLTAALNARFAGVGEPEHTRIDVTLGEYTTADRRYHMAGHTFTPPSSEPIESFAPKQYRRMQYLRRNLIDDLTAAEKIFVYKAHDGISEDQLAALFEAMRSYAETIVLFCVRLADPDHPAGTLERRDPGLFVGYLDKFSNVDTSFDLWIDLCRRVAAQVPEVRAR